MCNEVSLFKLWPKRNAREREEIQSEMERARPKVQPIRPAAKLETVHRKEREPDEVV